MPGTAHAGIVYCAALAEKLATESTRCEDLECRIGEEQDSERKRLLERELEYRRHGIRQINSLMRLKPASIKAAQLAKHMDPTDRMYILLQGVYASEEDFDQMLETVVDLSSDSLRHPSSRDECFREYVGLIRDLGFQKEYVTRLARGRLMVSVPESLVAYRAQNIISGAGS